MAVVFSRVATRERVEVGSDEQTGPPGGHRAVGVTCLSQPATPENPGSERSLGSQIGRHRVNHCVPRRQRPSYRSQVQNAAAAAHEACHSRFLIASTASWLAPAEVDLRGRDARVPKGVAHNVERRARSDEVDRERVPEPWACTRRAFSAFCASLGSKCRMYDWSSVPPRSVQKSGAAPEMPRLRRTSSQRLTSATVPASTPTTRRLPPFPRCTTSVPESASKSFTARASVSPTRSPHRQHTAISARLRTAVGARLEHSLPEV
jgi:hypothetical protein